MGTLLLYGITFVENLVQLHPKHCIIFLYLNMPLSRFNMGILILGNQVQNEVLEMVEHLIFKFIMGTLFLFLCLKASTVASKILYLLPKWLKTPCF